MTDYPRFKPVRGGPEDAWRDYHGAPLVDLVFKIAEALPRRPVHAQPRGFRHVVFERRALMQPVAGLVRVRATVLAAIAFGLLGWAAMHSGVPDMATARTTAVAAQLQR